MIDDEPELEPAEDTPATADAASEATPVTTARAPVRTRAARKRVPRRKASANVAPRAAVAKKRVKGTPPRPAPGAAVAKKRLKTVAPEAATEAARETPAAGHGGLVRVGPAGAAVWVDEALASALTDKDRKRLNKVVKRVLKRAKKR